MTDCHHKGCCGCERLATVAVEAVGTVMRGRVTVFELCDAHYRLLLEEAARKGVHVIKD